MPPGQTVPGETALSVASNSRSCLALVCWDGLEPLLELLLAADYNPSLDANAVCATLSGSLATPLYFALRRNRPSFVRLLLAVGVDVRASK